MRHIAMLIALITIAIKAHSQATTIDPTQYVPRATVALGYDFVKANAPPGGCQCFGLNGGFVSADVSVKFWLSVAAEATGGHADNISPLGQNLTLTTFTAGPRVNFRRNRTVLFTQGLFGLAHGSDSYFPTGSSYSTSANSFALSGGGGLDIEFTHRYAIRAVEVQYLHTTFNNGLNTSQNQFMVSAGVVVKFHGRYAQPTVHAASAPPRKLAMTCSANFRNVEAGQPLEITALLKDENAASDIAFEWVTDGGTISKRGPSASIDTTTVAAGKYHATGRATSASDGSLNAQCDVTFRIMEPVHASAAPTPPQPPPETAAAAVVSDFHKNMQDVYFDYDRWSLRPEAQSVITADATYLVAHPEMHVLLGGYSDERGTVTYNLALGEKRATAVRDALITAGVSGERLQVISYGKGSQVCTSASEACFQRNRRTTFLLRP